MKKFGVVLLSLGLIVAFCATASAADVKFSGQYYVSGVYDNNANLMDQNSYSRAGIWQRLRVMTKFQIAEGLTMTTRFDALEKGWGNADGYSVTAYAEDKTNSRVNIGASTKKIQENIEFEMAWTTFKTGIGQFDVGYQDQATNWGTVFGNSGLTRPSVRYTTKAGPVTLLAVYEKVFDGDNSAVAAYTKKVDTDADNYVLGGIYKFKGGEAGLFYKYVYDAHNRVLLAATTPYKTKVMALSPYFKATFGPVYLEGEATYCWGKAAAMEANNAGVTAQDIDKSGWNAYLLAKMKMGPAYFGGQFGFISGDDKSDATKNKQGPDGGSSWHPTLLLNNTDQDGAFGNKNTLATSNTGKTDSKGYVVYNIFGGFDPTPRLNVEAGLSFVSYDKKALTATTELTSAKLGTEIDLTAKYKIFDNLTYMVGGAYLITGDAYRGAVATAANEVGNTYLLINKLTLSF